MTAKSLSTSKMSLIKSTAVAAVAAIAVLLFAVLPAEYNIDLTGIGKLLGLTSLAETTGEFASTPLSADGLATAHAHPHAAQNRTLDIVLKPYDEVEYKALLPQGEPMLYSWSTSQGDVYYDFHGEPSEPEKYEEGFFEDYEQGDAASAHGSFIAPFAGHHGWYWLNYNDFDVTITLQASGYYEDIAEMYRNNQADPR